jgi:hypothetical protein
MLNRSSLFHKFDGLEAYVLFPKVSEQGTLTLTELAVKLQDRPCRGARQSHSGHRLECCALFVAVRNLVLAGDDVLSMLEDGQVTRVTNVT